MTVRSVAEITTRLQRTPSKTFRCTQWLAEAIPVWRDHHVTFLPFLWGPLLGLFWYLFSTPSELNHSIHECTVDPSSLTS